MDKKQYKSNKILLVFFIILIPIAVLLVRDLDNDTWFMLNHGRYILKNGLYPEYEPFTVHQGSPLHSKNGCAVFCFGFCMIGLAKSV